MSLSIGGLDSTTGLYGFSFFLQSSFNFVSFCRWCSSYHIGIEATKCIFWAHCTAFRRHSGTRFVTSLFEQKTSANKTVKVVFCAWRNCCRSFTIALLSVWVLHRLYVCWCHVSLVWFGQCLCWIFCLQERVALARRAFPRISSEGKA